MHPKTTPPRFLTPDERALRIQKIMKRKGYTAYTVASRAQAQGLNLTPIQVYRVSMQSSRPTPDPRLSTLVAIACACGVSAGFLIDRKAV